MYGGEPKGLGGHAEERFRPASGFLTSIRRRAKILSSVRLHLRTSSSPNVKVLDAATLMNILISAGVQTYFAVLVIGEELTR
jgi:hypothetical protein